MPALLIDPSYAELSCLVGQQVDAATDAGTVRLWLEHVSTPITFGNLLSFSVRLTGPVGQPLNAGAHLVSTDRGELVLTLEPVARDVRHAHYEAFFTEAVAVAF